MEDNPYPVAHEMIEAIIQQETDQGVEIALLKKKRDGYQAAAQTLALVAAQAGASKEELAEALSYAVESFTEDREGWYLNDALGLARLQADGCQKVCQALFGIAEELGVKREELIKAVGTTLDFHFKLHQGSTLKDLGIGLEDIEP